MKIKVTNLGPLRQAEFSLGDLTIICGDNNTGKTYATYALYGFLRFWKEMYAIPVENAVVTELVDRGVVSIPLAKYIDRATEFIDEACKEYRKQIPKVLASVPNLFEHTTFEVELIQDEIQPWPQFAFSLGTEKTPRILGVRREQDSPTVDVSLLVQEGAPRIPQPDIISGTGAALREIVFGPALPNAFIASAERTGAAIFRRELDFARNRLVEQIGSGAAGLDALHWLNKVYFGYPLPVQRNVDFMRQLEDLFKLESFILLKHPGVLEDFADIIGGEYKVKGDKLSYVPRGNKRLRLTVTESSSCVRALLDIGFYLRHSIRPGDLLMVDEPELSLHPKNQRRMARLFARLVNLGIKVFVTTHSDYIVKELNTLIMLNRDDPHIAEIREKKGYKKEELISAERVKVYVAGESLLKLEGKSRRSTVCTLVPADVDPELGIEAKSFDDTINDMNRIQQDILFGGE